MGLILLAVAAGAFLFRGHSDVKVDDFGFGNSDESDMLGTDFYDKLLDVRLALPDGWSVSDDKAPQRGVTTHATFRNGSCVVAYVTVDNDEFSSAYDQVSFGLDEIDQRSNITSSSWYLPVEQMPAGFEFDYDVNRHYFPGEFRRVGIQSSWYHTKGASGVSSALVLYDADSGNVSDDCDIDFVRMYGSMKREFEEVAWYERSTGFIFLAKSGARQSAYLYKTDDKANLEEIRDRMGQPIWMGRNFYIDIQISRSSEGILFPYPFGKPTQLGWFDTLAQSLTTIELAGAAGEGQSADGMAVVQYLLIGEKIYFLFANKDCGEYRVQCDSGLFVYDMEAKELKSIKTGLDYSRLGYDSANRILALSRGFGDAGMFSVTYEFLDEANGYANLGTFSHSGSDGQPDDPTKQARYERIVKGDYK